MPYHIKYMYYLYGCTEFDTKAALVMGRKKKDQNCLFLYLHKFSAKYFSRAFKFDIKINFAYYSILKIIIKEFLPY